MAVLKILTNDFRTITVVLRHILKKINHEKGKSLINLKITSSRIQVERSNEKYRNRLGKGLYISGQTVLFDLIFRKALQMPAKNKTTLGL